MKKKLILFDWGNIVESHTTGYSCYDAWNDFLFHDLYYIFSLQLRDISPQIHRQRKGDSPR